MVKGINNPPPRHPSLTGLDTKRTGTTAKPDTAPTSPGTTSPTRTTTEALQANSGQKAPTMSAFRAPIDTLRNVSQRMSEAKTRVADALSHAQTKVESGIQMAHATADTALTHASNLHGKAERTLDLANTMMGLSESASKLLGPIAEKYPQAAFLGGLKMGLDGLSTFKPGLEQAGITLDNMGPVLAQLRTYVPPKPSTPPPDEKTADAVA
jgi:hypothetical protein